MLPEQVLREEGQLAYDATVLGVTSSPFSMSPAQRAYIQAHLQAKRAALHPRYLFIIQHYPDRKRPRNNLSHLIGES